MWGELFGCRNNVVVPCKVAVHLLWWSTMCAVCIHEIEMKWIRWTGRQFNHDTILFQTKRCCVGRGNMYFAYEWRTMSSLWTPTGAQCLKCLRIDGRTTLTMALWHVCMKNLFWVQNKYNYTDEFVIQKANKEKELNWTDFALTMRTVSPHAHTYSTSKCLSIWEKWIYLRRHGEMWISFQMKLVRSATQKTWRTDWK